MSHPKPNLSLKFNKSLQNLNCDGPYTPLDQTLRTPVDGNHLPQNQQAFYFAGHGQPAPKQESLYSNPNYNESDDILTDIDEPMGAQGYRTTRNYTVAFTPIFDQLVMGVYNKILSLPTTTPFSGIIPPSGLVSKVANETMASLLASTSTSNPPVYDHQSIINSDYLKNHFYQPIFLQLIRKRLIDLCAYHSSASSTSHPQNTQKLPESTTVSVTSSNNGVVMNSGSGAGLKQSSISNLSLTELNISNFNANNPNNRSRSSSLSLRKQSLTRNNSYSNNSWLHVGNINSIRPHSAGTQHEQFNASTDSLQSIQDYVPQSFINRSAGGANSQNGFNTMMMDYQTPTSSNKGSVSSASSWTPPNTGTTHIIQNSINNGHNATSDYEEFLFQQQQAARSRSSSRGNNSLPRPLTINTECANIQALNALNGVSTPNSMNGRPSTGLALDSPFMSATTPSEDYGYFSNGFGPLPNAGSGPSSSNSSITESPVNQATGNNDAMLVDSSKINLPTQFSLSEKKRDSLKMKRGIH